MPTSIVISCPILSMLCAKQHCQLFSHHTFCHCHTMACAKQHCQLLSHPIYAIVILCYVPINMAALVSSYLCHCHTMLCAHQHGRSCPILSSVIVILSHVPNNIASYCPSLYIPCAKQYCELLSHPIICHCHTMLCANQHGQLLSCCILCHCFTHIRNNPLAFNCSNQFLFSDRILAVELLIWYGSFTPLNYVPDHEPHSDS